MSSTAPLPQPSFGYVFISKPHSSEFHPVGRHFSISFIQHKLDFDQNNIITVCLWLGPALVNSETPVITAFLIWPSERLILPIGASLSVDHPSDVVVFERSRIKETDISASPTNTVFKELLYINDKPCIVFVKQDVDANALIHDATSLSFVKYTIAMVCDLVKYLEGQKVKGDAFESSALAEWFAAAGAKLDVEDPTGFLFDPTVLMAGIITFLGKILLENHKFDINREDLILVPFIFVRSWSNALLSALNGPEKEGIVKAILNISV